VEPVKIIVITGLSGSGKSAAMAALEDAGFYCVDNLPVALLPRFLDLPRPDDAPWPGFGFVMDLRDKGFMDTYAGIFEAIGRQGHDLSILFLEAEEDALVRRYSQTRRQHPLATQGPLLAGIRAEKDLLAPLRRRADRCIDTSNKTVHQLKALIFDVAWDRQARRRLLIQVTSFGYKHGLPPEADLVVDVRFLANPYFEPRLRALTGETEAVRTFVLGNPEAGRFLTKYRALLDYLIPLYEKEGKAYLTIAVGCTGGKHRSVVLARELYLHLEQSGRRVSIGHRDITR